MTMPWLWLATMKVVVDNDATTYAEEDVAGTSLNLRMF